MEEHDVTMLNSLASRTGDYPDVKARLEQHLLETLRQAEALDGILRRGGARRSQVR
jgi:ferritin-like metal-binding protein YciE